MTETHRHYWTHTDDDPTWRCTDCAETTETCQECGRYVGDEKNPSSLLICERCVRRWQRTFAWMMDAYAWWVREMIASQVSVVGPAPVRAARIDGIRVKGTGSGRSQKIAVSDIEATLDSWARFWHGWVGDAEPHNPVQYLHSHLLWAAHNPVESDWEVFKTEMGHCLAAARSAARLLPERMPWPCVHCGGEAVRDRATKDWKHLDDGLSDEVRCTGCKLTWPSAGQFEKLARQHMRDIPETKPAMLVTLEEAAKNIWPHVPASTIYTGVSRDRAKHEAYLRALDEHPYLLDQWEAECEGVDKSLWAKPPRMPKPVERMVPERGYDKKGTPLYMVADLALLIERREDESRRGPKVRDTLTKAV